MITLPNTGGQQVLADSTGTPLEIGDRIRFRGQEFTLKAVGEKNEMDVYNLLFEEEITHTTEIPHECNVDKVRQ